MNAAALGTGAIPLKLAKRISSLASEAWSDGSLLEKVSPVTRDLLRFWAPDGGFADLRAVNFHEGQWQAILNTIYVHEVVKAGNVVDLYSHVDTALLSELDAVDLAKEKHGHAKYCIKMATGTGKTWVLSALLIWQYLNAKNEEQSTGRFSKNFLLIAPGIIVYERLLDAYLGKRRPDGRRDFEESDFKRFESLFIPPAYKEELFGFIQSSVAQKDEIGRKVTGDGLIAITNWHVLAPDTHENAVESPLERPDLILKKALPITPGTSAGHSLAELDAARFGEWQTKYLGDLPDLVVFNDEAHHLSEFKKSDDVLEKKWQEALDKISEGKKEGFVQVDFSATPYSVTGSGQKRSKHYFPHIIANFELVKAIQKGLVKTVAIDKRKELAAIPLEFKAEKDGKTLVLSSGQRVMLRAGLSKLKILEDGFKSLDARKHPKMLVICEDTKVVPLVAKFLKAEGLSEDQIMEIHSNRKGDVGQEEWEKIKQKLFSADASQNPKVILSVLMLREGFDVNNICVIVPLRSSSSYILLEQTIGRGLRLMWREPEYQESKNENREKLLVRKEEPDNYMDILSIIEHPAYIEYYEKELSGAFIEIKEPPKTTRTVGDLVSIPLKPDFARYDLVWPLILHDREEHLRGDEISVGKLEPFPIPLEQLLPLVKAKGDVFFGEELTVRTKFGEYSVTADIFTAKSYNAFIQKIVHAVSSVPVKIGRRAQKQFPVMQINSAIVAKAVDEYIRSRLFNQVFDPLKGNNWRVLLLTQERIIHHIVKNVSQAIYDLQNELDVTQAKIIPKHFSEAGEVKVRETYSIRVAKTIYDRIAFPSNRGGFEKAFIEFVDSDSKVHSFAKIDPYKHLFACVMYVREDGMLAHYFPDFMVRIGNRMYVVETKSEKDLSSVNVRQKRLAMLDWIAKINELDSQHRVDCTWQYVLLGEKTFYGMRDQGASTEEILNYARLSKAKVEGKLDLTATY